jgi:hypothetical protein
MIALGLGLAASIAGFALALGVRPDAAAAIPATAAKLAFALLAAACGLWTFDRLGRPDQAVGKALAPGVAAFIFAAIWIGVDIALFGAGDWKARLVGHNATHCLTLIPLFALAPLLALIVMLRRAAPVRPRLAGAAAGLGAAGVAAALYALNCNDDSALFVAAWYPLAGALVTALGAALGGLIKW